MVRGDTSNTPTRDQLSLWGLRSTSAQLTPPTPGAGSGPLVYSGPPRVLEIGCGDGTWCFRVKEEQPDWIVEGIDDANHVSLPSGSIDLFLLTSRSGFVSDLPRTCSKSSYTR